MPTGRTAASLGSPTATWSCTAPYSGSTRGDWRVSSVEMFAPDLAAGVQGELGGRMPGTAERPDGVDRSEPDGLAVRCGR